MINFVSTKTFNSLARSVFYYSKMATSKLETANFSTKFRGCSIGALIGDCLGAPFEFVDPVSEQKLGKFFTCILNGETRNILQYTDDTAMALSIMKSLVQNRKICPVDMAKKFVNVYFTDPLTPSRSYGGHVRVVFEALRKSNFQDVFLPARTQFNGTGSYGNGAAMRIAPLALFVHGKDDGFIKNAVEQSSFITHTHPLGYNGALLLCLAIHIALETDSSKELDPMEFISELEKRMKRISNEGYVLYKESLDTVRSCLEKQEELSPQEIALCLGNDEVALKSIPTAIYSFLRALKPLQNFENANSFVRTIYYAISVGYDTDTIATMAGAIAGALYGDAMIPDVIKKRCAEIDEIEELTDMLLKAHQALG